MQMFQIYMSFDPNDDLTFEQALEKALKKTQNKS